MDPPHISQQTSTTLPLTGQLPAARDAPGPKALRRGLFGGPLQWLLEGPGWSVLRPAVDFVLLYAAVVLALGGVGAALHAPAMRAPLLFAAAAGDGAALPARAVPHASARAGARRGGAGRERRVGRGDDGRDARPVRQRARPEPGRLGAGVAVRAARGRRRACAAVARAALGARETARRQAGADHGRRPGRLAGGAAAGAPPRVRAGADRLPRRRSALDRRGRRARDAGAGHRRGSRRDRAQDRRAESDRGVLLRRRRARQPPDPALPGAGRRGLGRAADVRHDQQPRRL